MVIIVVLVVISIFIMIIITTKTNTIIIITTRPSPCRLTWPVRLRRGLPRPELLLELLDLVHEAHALVEVGALRREKSNVRQSDPSPL
jgi:hypothetical protein